MRRKRYASGQMIGLPREAEVRLSPIRENGRRRGIKRRRRALSLRAGHRGRAREGVFVS